MLVYILIISLEDSLMSYIIRYADFAIRTVTEYHLISREITLPHMVILKGCIISTTKSEDPISISTRL